MLVTNLTEKIINALPEKLSPWNREGYAKNPAKFYHKSGWCESLEVFKKYWNRFPNNPCQLTIRNFNKIDGHITIQIKTPGIGWDKLYFHRVNLADFFPEHLIHFLKEEEQTKKGISAKFFVKVGDLISKAIGRRLTILHQEGGDPEYAAFTEYGPYLPDKFVHFDFAPKSTWGFLSLENGDFEECDIFGGE